MDLRRDEWIGVVSPQQVQMICGTSLCWDSGSVSTACPYAWCSDISVNDGDKVYLQDIQQRRIPSHGSRVVPLKLWCKVKFDVADVAYPVVSLGKRIDSGFTFSFDDHVWRSFERVESLCGKMRRSWLESKAQIVAPIDEVANEEMEVDDDGEGAGRCKSTTTCR